MRRPFQDPGRCITDSRSCTPLLPLPLPLLPASVLIPAPRPEKSFKSPFRLFFSCARIPRKVGVCRAVPHAAPNAQTGQRKIHSSVNDEGRSWRQRPEGVPMVPPHRFPLSRQQRLPEQQQQQQQQPRRRPRRRSVSATICPAYLALALLAIAARLLPVQGYRGIDDGSRSDWQHPSSRPRRSDLSSSPSSRRLSSGGVGGANERIGGGGDVGWERGEQRRRWSSNRRDGRRRDGGEGSQHFVGRRGAGIGRGGGGGWAERKRSESTREIIEVT